MENSFKNGNSFKKKKKKQGTEQLYNPAIPLLGIHPKETGIERDTCAPMFIATLYTIARTWKQTGFKSGKEYVKAILCYPAYLTYIQSISREMLDWMKHKLESRLPGEISITSDMQITPPLKQKVKKSLLMKMPLDKRAS